MFAAINGFSMMLEKNKKTVDGFPTYSYRVITAEPRTIFEGSSFKPSVAGVRNELIIPIELLQWICLEYAANDHSLFDHYNDEQMEFATSGSIEEYSVEADQFWTLLESKKYLHSLNEHGCKVIKFRHYQIPYVFMGDR